MKLSMQPTPPFQSRRLVSLLHGFAAALGCLLVTACGSHPGTVSLPLIVSSGGPMGQAQDAGFETEVVPVIESRELAVSDVQWKERLEQPYVFVEVRGDYRELGGSMRKPLERVRLAGVEASGPPFALYYDDPASVPVEQLRARVCLPVQAGAGAAPGLGADMLPRAMVVYANVTGAYPELPRVYPSLFAYLSDHGWVADGPLREIYFVDPGTVTDWRELASELQVPWKRGA